MVRDLILDMKERDLLTEDKSDVTKPVFNSLWGNLFEEDKANDILICNIIIPEAYWDIIKYQDNELICRFTSVYVPNTSNFRVRLVKLKNGEYSLFDNIRGILGSPACSYALTRNVSSPIQACMLPYIDIDGEFLVKMVENAQSEILDKAYIYSSKATDISVNYSDDQAAQLLSLCAPGKSYRYPTTGVGIYNYLNCVMPHSDLQKILEAQFNGDDKPIQEAYFDNTTCGLDVMFNPEKEVSDTGLMGMDMLNIHFFDSFTDDYVRRNTTLSEVSDMDFIEVLDQYDQVLNLILFKDHTTSVTHIVNNVKAGAFDGEGNIIESDEYFIVTATLEGNTIIMFDDEQEDEVKDAPIFIVNDHDETRLYTSLVEQPYWITEMCNKCFVLKKRATIKYMVKQERFREGKGLYIVAQTSDNIKNMVGLVQDVHTGRLLGIVSNSTNINDMTLDEITQHIYASQTN